MFDHMAVVLSPKKLVRQTPAIPTISNKIMRDPDLDYVVGLSVADTYLNSTAVPNENGWDTQKIKIGRAKMLLRQVAPSNPFTCQGARTELEELRREGAIAEIRETLDDFPYRILKR